MSSHSFDHLEKATREWVQEVVIGHNFCPFAKKDVERQRLRVSVCDSAGVRDVLQAMLDELHLLDQSIDAETTLIVLSAGFNDFDDYLDLLDMANQLIDQGGYRGIYQLASFHPDYCFADTQPDDVTNNTNRSPYPLLHLIREESMERVLSKFPDPENIPVRNEQKARELGSDYFSELLKRLQTEK